jgi:8-oxo-dGTP pyrophosphatase MutT (NUDIX family)
MYKVFFNQRTVFLRDDFKDTFRKNYGLFYKYESKEQLFDLLDAYYSLSKIKTLYLFHTDLDFLWKEFVSCYKFIRAAGGLVYNSKGEFLIIKRNGIWDLPKGKTEEGETSGETAIREVSEECGLVSPILKKFLVKTYHTYYIKNTPVLKETEWFEMNTNGREKTRPQIKEDITEIKWLKKSEASVIMNNTYPSIIDVLRKAGVFKYPPSPASH